MIKEIEKKIDDNWEWFKSFDRRVYLLHVQMAAQANKEWKDELIERYRFQDAIQRLYKEADRHQEKAFLYTKHLLSMSPDEVHPEFLGEVMQVLRDSWRALKKIIQDAREINLPAMKNFEEGERLADFILEAKMVPEPPLSYVKGNWCLKLVDQLGSCDRAASAFTSRASAEYSRCKRRSRRRGSRPVRGAGRDDRTGDDPGGGSDPGGSGRGGVCR